MVARAEPSGSIGTVDGTGRRRGSVRAPEAVRQLRREIRRKHLLQLRFLAAPTNIAFLDQTTVALLNDSTILPA